MPTWRELLIEFDITKWHDRSSSHPLNYLGFPLCSSNSQRDVFFHDFHQKIRIACQLHSQRNLSIVGLTTVLNSLICSRLWHIVRVATLTKVQLIALRSVILQFINKNITPPFSVLLLSSSKYLGGINPFDPLAQVNALQTRWLISLLRPSLGSTKSLVMLFSGSCCTMVLRAQMRDCHSSSPAANQSL